MLLAHDLDGRSVGRFVAKVCGFQFELVLEEADLFGGDLAATGLLPYSF